jgi:spermidine synthase
MAIGFQHPKVKVHVGDGFKYLEDFKDTFDVIITDSSDPEGPAESLFQKPYFQLLFGALREGGVITTQGCMFSLVHMGFNPERNSSSLKLHYPLSPSPLITPPSFFHPAIDFSVLSNFWLCSRYIYH